MERMFRTLKTDVVCAELLWQMGRGGGCRPERAALGADNPDGIAYASRYEILNAPSMILLCDKFTVLCALPPPLSMNFAVPLNEFGVCVLGLCLLTASRTLLGTNPDRALHSPVL